MSFTSEWTDTEVITLRGVAKAQNDRGLCALSQEGPSAKVSDVTSQPGVTAVTRQVKTDHSGILVNHREKTNNNCSVGRHGKTGDEI